MIRKVFPLNQKYRVLYRIPIQIQKSFTKRELALLLFYVCNNDFFIFQLKYELFLRCRKTDVAPVTASFVCTALMFGDSKWDDQINSTFHCMVNKKQLVSQRGPSERKLGTFPVLGIIIVHKPSNCFLLCRIMVDKWFRLLCTILTE